jgi:hypothetical protein
MEQGFARQEAEVPWSNDPEEHRVEKALVVGEDEERTTARYTPAAFRPQAEAQRKKDTV